MDDWRKTPTTIAEVLGGGGGEKKRFTELHINHELDSNENLPFSLSSISGFES